MARTWGVMYPGSKVTCSKLTKVSWHEVLKYFTSDITVKIYSGGDDAPGTLLHTFTVSPEQTNGFHEVTLASPVMVTRGENLWITLTATGTYLMSMCYCSERNNKWIYWSGEWTNFHDDGSFFADKGWMIRAYMEPVDLDEDAVVWNTANISGFSCHLTGLTPETTYLLKVRGDYGSDGYSPWTKILPFTTYKVCDANGDGKMDFADAMCIVDYLMNKPLAEFNAAAADVNNDGQVTIADAVIVVSIIMNP